MTVSLSARVRLIVYIVTGVGSAVVAYLVAKGLIGDAEVTLWAAIAALVNGLAALNTPAGGEHRREGGHVDLAVVLLVGILVVLVLVLAGFFR